MIKSLTLKCFRKHTDLTVNFTTGLNAIRGVNEGGKTTLIEAAMYAFYGAKALRDTLAETVTWGKKEGDLKVIAVLAKGGVEYTFIRSKGGAEVRVGGEVKVTGQNEVSAFAAELIGGDARTASAITMASQSGLRGALDEGPAAVSGLMGKLANFDLIDQILKAAEERLALGSTAPLRSKLEEARVSLEALRRDVPEANLWEGFEELRANFASQIETWQGELVTRRTATRTALEAFTAGRQKHEQYQRLCKDIEDTLTSIRLVEADQAKQAPIAQSRPAPERLQTLRERIEQEKNLKKLLDGYKVFASLPAYPVVFWDEAAESFEAELARVTAEDQRLAGEISTAQAVLKSIGQRRITSGKCPTCGHAARSDEHVAEHNAAVDVEINAQQLVIDDLVQKRLAIGEELTALRNLRRSAQPFLDAVTALAGMPVRFDHGNFPPRITWTGEKPSQIDPNVAKRELSDLEDKVRAADMATGRLQSLQAQHNNLVEKIEALKLASNEFVLPELDPLQAAYNLAVANETEATTRIEDLRTHEAGAARQRDEAKRAYETAKARIEETEKRVVEYEEMIQRTEFNNALVAKLKKLKPMITDHLWNTVLAAVSNFFSTLRAEKSVVTKEANGFKVNGKSIDSLSGSTIDVLALAIRVALAKTFIPHASFMVLDEPAHGCDVSRTANVLGFLSSIGFEQTLLASHDELSESVADNIITVGT